MGRNILFLTVHENGTLIRVSFIEHKIRKTVYPMLFYFADQKVSKQTFFLNLYEGLATRGREGEGYLG